jgi:hypothetical protein
MGRPLAISVTFVSKEMSHIIEIESLNKIRHMSSAPCRDLIGDYIFALRLQPLFCVPDVSTFFKGIDDCCSYRRT